jgi:hypothetical protein
MTEQTIPRTTIIIGYQCRGQTAAAFCSSRGQSYDAFDAQVVVHSRKATLTIQEHTAGRASEEF